MALSNKRIELGKLEPMFDSSLIVRTLSNQPTVSLKHIMINGQSRPFTKVPNTAKLESYKKIEIEGGILQPLEIVGTYTVESELGDRYTYTLVVYYFYDTRYNRIRKEMSYLQAMDIGDIKPRFPIDDVFFMIECSY